MAGAQGFEPHLPDSESGVLPLNYAPIARRKYAMLRRFRQRWQRIGGGNTLSGLCWVVGFQPEKSRLEACHYRSPLGTLAERVCGTELRINRFAFVAHGTVFARSRGWCAPEIYYTA